jgi:hypothetical protein
MREVYASMLMTGGETFSAVFIGALKDDPTIIDMLNVGSHNTAGLYDPQKFRQQFVTNPRACPALKPVTASAAVQPVQALIMDPSRDTCDAWASQRQQMGIPEDNIKIVETSVTSVYTSEQKSTVDRVIASQDTFKDAPIHYMKVAISGNDYEILMGSAATMDRVRYLEFEYHWTGSWGLGQPLEDLIKLRLAKKGMVCYWSGSDGNLWRITDCWLDHYTYHSWSRITCVNSKFPEVKPIQDKMEQLFAATIQKNQKFGG